jgi:vanillate O-demethylase ferredoxin subunit
MEQLTVRVARKYRDAADIAVFELEDVAQLPLPPFSAGAHIDVHVAPGMVRQYSLCNDPAEQHRYVIGVLRDKDTRGGSGALHDKVQENDLIRIGAPRNLFPLAAAEHSLLLAGGIGITPLLCMAEHLHRAGAGFALHYCSRSAAHAAFRERIAAAPWAQHAHFHFDDGDSRQRFELAGLLADSPRHTHVYTCGPGGFIDHVVSTAADFGWDPQQVHHEYFGRVASQENDGTNTQAGGDQAFDVRIASSGRIIHVAADIPVSSALAQHGVCIPVSCEQGVCGSCVTRVLEGEPDHRDLLFSDAQRAANDQFTPCCSRSRSKMLVLDL